MLFIGDIPNIPGRDVRSEIVNNELIANNKLLYKYLFPGNSFFAVAKISRKQLKPSETNLNVLSLYISPGGGGGKNTNIFRN